MIKMKPLLFLIFPLAEIAVFILVGKAIGVLPTLALVAASSAIGFVMLRDAGLATILKLQRREESQAAILSEGGAKILAGLLLLVPGFLTDLAALAVLTPSFRRSIFRHAAVTPSGHPPHKSRPDVIDGDFRRLDG